MTTSKPKDIKQEVAIPTVNGESICFESAESNPEGCSYIRFVNSKNEEVAYWSHEEWKESPQLVMGAIMACLQNGSAY